jgi:hypothetical protein
VGEPATRLSFPRLTWTSPFGRWQAFTGKAALRESDEMAFEAAAHSSAAGGAA